MSEAASGSAALAGNPSGDTGGQGGVPAGGAPAAGGDTWLTGIQDADLRGYAENKGWQNPVDVLNGYRNLEKLVGQDKIPMPKGADDKEGWSRVYDSLGRPKSADEYKLNVPEGQNDAFAKMAAAKFHELGLSANQASQLADWYNAAASQAMETNNQTASVNAERDMISLRQEWGQAYDENVELGRRAAREFGLNGDMLGKMENAMGTKGLLEFMSRVGRGLTEHNFESGRTTNSFGMTPDAAKNRIQQLRGDKEWSSKYLSGNADARAEMDRLMKLAFPE
jgi:hypothetical protein